MDLTVQNNNFYTANISSGEKLHTTMEVLSPIVPMRRMACLPDEINQGHYAKAAGLATLMAINLPEDTRDLKAATKQIFAKKIPQHYKVAQVPFSFFRGTFLEPIVNKLGKLGVKLHQMDKTLYDTKFGQYLAKKVGFEYVDDIETGRKINRVFQDNNNKISCTKVEVLARQLEGKPFGKLIGNSLLRIPVLSTYLMAGLELPTIYKAFSNPQKSEDKAICGTAQIVKSSVNLATITAAVSIFGALLKGKGAVGSLTGMAIGSVVGAHGSKLAGEKIDDAACKFKTWIS